MNRPPTAEHQRLADSLARRADWKRWGPYVAERAWGTVREDYSAIGRRLVVLPPRPRPEPGLPLERGRPGGLLQPVPEPLPGRWPSGTSATRSSRSGSSASPDTRATTARTSRNITYYLDATPTPLVHEDALQVSAGRVSLRAARRGVAAAKPRTEREFELIDAIGDAFSRGPLLRRLHRVRQGRPGRHPLPDHGRQPRPRAGRRCTSCPTSGSATPGRGDTRTIGPSCGPSPARRSGSCTSTWASGGGTSTSARTPRRSCSPRTRRTSSGSSACPIRARTSRTRSTRRSSAAATTGSIPRTVGTKAAAHYRADGRAGRVAGRPHPVRGPAARRRLRRLRRGLRPPAARGRRVLRRPCTGPGLTDDERLVQRQALAGLLWSKQFYHYSVELWLKGDPAGPAAAAGARAGPERRAGAHFTALDVLSVPDKWEYPWFAAWDTAFHCMALARVDPEWAKRQLVLLCREWYMHPNGQLPAYEWDFGDVNPPVHARAARRVYELERELTGAGDTDVPGGDLPQDAPVLHLVGQPQGRRGPQRLPGGLPGHGQHRRVRPQPPQPARRPAARAGRRHGLDGRCSASTCWPSRSSSPQTGPAYESMATKFFEHFVAIAHAINGICGTIGHVGRPRTASTTTSSARPGGPPRAPAGPLVRGPDPAAGGHWRSSRRRWDRLDRFRRRVDWYLRYRPHLTTNACLLTTPGERGPPAADHRRPGQARSASCRGCSTRPSSSPTTASARSPRNTPTSPFQCHGSLVAYEPAESTSPIYGGNSNWRGPIWFPINFLIIQALREYHRYFGDELSRSSCPTGSGRRVDLNDGRRRARRDA